MEHLSSTQVNWKKLDSVLQQITSAVNSRTPLKGYGILLSETAGGILIGIDPKILTPTDSTNQNSSPSLPDADLVDPNGVTAGWQIIQILSGDSIYQMYVWGTPPYNPQPCATISSTP